MRLHSGIILSVCSVMVAGACEASVPLASAPSNPRFVTLGLGDSTTIAVGGHVIGEFVIPKFLATAKRVPPDKVKVTCGSTSGTGHVQITWTEKIGNDIVEKIGKYPLQCEYKHDQGKGTP